MAPFSGGVNFPYFRLYSSAFRAASNRRQPVTDRSLTAWPGAMRRSGEWPLTSGKSWKPRPGAPSWVAPTTARRQPATIYRTPERYLLHMGGPKALHLSEWPRPRGPVWSTSAQNEADSGGNRARLTRFSRRHEGHGGGDRKILPVPQGAPVTGDFGPQSSPSDTTPSAVRQAAPLTIGLTSAGA